MNGSTKSLIAVCVVSLIAGCGKKSHDGNKTDTAAGSGNGQVALSGSLALSATNLLSAMPDKLLAFPVKNGELDTQGGGRVIRGSIRADGSFELNLPKPPKMADFLKADGTVDIAKVRADFPEAQGASDQEITEKVKEESAKEAAGQGDLGAGSYVVVSYVSSATGDKVAEAETMAFVGFSAGGRALINMPVANAAGDKIDMGKIDISGDTGKSEREVSSSDFKVSTDVLKELAATNDALKILKNYYMNYNLDTMEGYSTQPYFAFHGSSGKLLNQYSLATDVTYSGYGLYFRQDMRTAGIKMSDVCGASHKNLKLIPPSDIKQVSMDYSKMTNGQPAETTVTYNATNPLDNSNVSDPAADSSGQNRVYCGGMSATVYIHGGEGESSKAAGVSVVDGWNWGSGQGFEGDVASGIWTLDYDGSTLASFDLASAKAVDKDGHPVVYVPSVKIIADNNNVITGASIKFNVWDAASGAFKEVEDLSAFNAIASQVSISITDYNNGTNPTFRATSSQGGNQDASLAIGTFPSAYDVTIDPTKKKFLFPTQAAMTARWNGTDTTDNVGQSIAVQYQAYGNSYMFDFRPYSY